MLYNGYSDKLSGHSKSRKDNISYLNIMVVGTTGSGKTAFVRTFCESLKQDIIQGSLKESKPMVLKESLRSTDELYTVSMHVEENGQRTALTIVDTPGFTSGPTLEHQLRFIAKYIDLQFERTLAEESKVKRDAKALDTHIHTCLYFLDIKSINGLSEMDKYLLKMLSSRVNIIPVIGRADTLTMAQREQLKSIFRKEVFDNLKIPIYGSIDVEGDETPLSIPEEQRTSSHQMNVMLDVLQECVSEDKDEDAAAVMSYLRNIPFTLIGYEEDPETGRPISITNPIPTASSMINLHPMQIDSEDIEMLPSPKVSTPTISRNSSRRMTISNPPTLGRRYPWAVVECCNPSHCDFAYLKNALLSSHRDMLRIDTFERFYEQYRTEKLLNYKAKKMINFNGPKPIVHTIRH